MREGEMSIIFTARLTQVLFSVISAAAAAAVASGCCGSCCAAAAAPSSPPRGAEKKERKGTVAVVERCEFSYAPTECPTGPSSVSGQWALWAVGCGEDIEQQEE